MCELPDSMEGGHGSKQNCVDVVFVVIKSHSEDY